jgi:hypothetical protein
MVEPRWSERRVALVEHSLTRVTMERDALRQKVGEAIKERPPVYRQFPAGQPLCTQAEVDAWADRIEAAHQFAVFYQLT